MALCSRRAQQQCYSNAGRSRFSRIRLQPMCIHKEYSRRDVESVYKGSSTVLTTTEDIVIECLTLMRKGELAALSPYIPQQRLAAPGSPIPVAGVPVHEHGPLARCSAFMDAAARRVLPGHLLRRSRIQSSLQLGGSCLLRVSLTACTGEEVLLNWKLGLTQLPGIAEYHLHQQQQHHPQQQQQMVQQQVQDGAPPLQQQGLSDNGSSSISSGRSERPEPVQQQQAMSNTERTSSPGSRSIWQVLSVERDTSADTNSETYPKGPHPRSSPELVILAQLQALRQHDVISACGFNMLGRHASGSAWDTHLAAFRGLLKQPHYHLLAGHTRAELGSSALPSQRHFLQEVVLYECSEDALGDEPLDLHTNYSDNGSDGSCNTGNASSWKSSTGGNRGLAGRFLWRLGMQADGCWMVRSIEVL